MDDFETTSSCQRFIFCLLQWYEWQNVPEWFMVAHEPNFSFKTSLSCLQSQQLEPKWLLCIVKSWYKPAQWNGFTAMQQSPSGLVINPDWVPVSQYAGEHTLHCTIGLHPFDTTDGSSGESYNLNRILLKVRVIDFKASNCILLNWIWRSSILSYLLFWTVRENSHVTDLWRTSNWRISCRVVWGHWQQQPPSISSCP